MISVHVKVTYTDDKSEEFVCYDAPDVGSDWITIYPFKDPTARINLRKDSVHRVEVVNKCDGKH